MRHEDLSRYIRMTEEMVNPAQVAKVSQATGFLSRLPLGIQKRIAAKGSVKNPYMGFVVEPYCFFLAWEITDTAGAEQFLPRDYRLVPVSMFADGKPRYAAITGAFNIHTSVFWGSRLELYLIAENKRTGMMSWIIADYLSNTNSFDPGQGFVGPTTSRCVVTTSWNSQFILDVEGLHSPKRLALEADISGQQNRALEPRLWIEGNLSVDYGGELDAGDTQPFGLIFDPGEMQSAWDIPLDAVRIQDYSFIPAYLADRPFESACFPYAQHFVTTSMPTDLGLRNRSDLEKALAQFRTRGIPLAEADSRELKKVS